MIKFSNITKEICRNLKRGTINNNANQKRSWSWRFIQAIVVAELNINFTPVLCVPISTVINSKSRNVAGQVKCHVMKPDQIVVD
jgi:hypothetical protein